MSWLVKMNHTNYLNGMISERTLKKRYPNVTQAQETANRLAFVRMLDDETVIAECVAVVVEQTMGGVA